MMAKAAYVYILCAVCCLETSLDSGEVSINTVSIL